MGSASACSSSPAFGQWAAKISLGPAPEQEAACLGDVRDQPPHRDLVEIWRVPAAALEAAARVLVRLARPLSRLMKLLTVSSAIEEERWAL